MEDELTPEDFEQEVKFDVIKSAFESKELHCDNCDRKMDKVFIEIEIPYTFLKVRLEAFRCGKCGKEFLSSEQAEKLDRALAVSKAIEKKGVVYERAGNFDGSNVFVRFPAQMIKGNNIKAEIMPISQTEFIVNFKNVDE